MKNTHNKNSVISASEIGQYEYCSNAWFLQKKGYKPNSVFLEKGVEKHKELGNTIDKTETNLKKSNIFAIIGYLLLIIAFLVIILEVI
jgi:hypothetical protein